MARQAEVPGDGAGGPPGFGRADLAWLALLALLALSLFPGPVLRGEVLYRRDLGLLWVPQAETLVRTVASGAWPLWDPWRGFGQPLLADPRAAVAYPPTWLGLLLRPGPLLTVYLVGHVLLMGAGTYRCARRLGASRLAATLAGAAAQCSGPLLSLANTGHHYAAAAWMPWVLAEALGCLESGGRRRVLGLALAAAAQVLAGSPDLNLLTALLVFLAALPALAGGRVLPQVGRLAGAALLAAALSAVQWAPTLVLVARGVRGALTPGEAAEWSVSPARAAEMALPVWWNALPLRPEVAATVLEGREPFLLSIYVGLPVLALAALGLLHGADRRRLGLALAALVGGLYALGPATPVHGLLSTLTPLRFLRFPSKALVLPALALCLLAATGLDALSRLRRRWRVAPFAAGLLLCAGALALVARADRWGPRILAPVGTAPAALVHPQLVALAGTGAALAMAGLGAALAPPAAAAIVAASAAVDLAVHHHDLNPSAPAALFAARPEVLARLPADPLLRVYAYDYSRAPEPARARDTAPPPYVLARSPAGWPAPAARVLGAREYLQPPSAAQWEVAGSWDLDTVGFYAPVHEALTERLRDVEGTPAHLRLLQLGAVDAVLALRPAGWWADLEPWAELPGLFAEPIRVFRVPGRLPRAYAVSGALVQGGEDTVRTLVEPGFDPAREVVLDAGEPRPPEAGFAGEVRVREHRADRVVLEASLPAPGFVVLVETFDAGWRATVDGQAAPVRRANGVFRAVAVPAGVHRVVMRYRPPEAIAGALVSVAGLLGWLLLARRA